MAMDSGRASSPIGKHTLARASPGQGGRADGALGLSPVPPRVYIISETRLFREGLRAMMTREGRLEIVGHGSCHEALEQVGSLAPDLAVLHISRRDCFVIPRQLHTILPALRIVAVAV